MTQDPVTEGRAKFESLMDHFDKVLVENEIAVAKILADIENIDKELIDVR